jgi:cell division topological specificity factor
MRGEIMTSWLRLFKKYEGTAQLAKDRLQIIVARERTMCSDKPGYLPKLQQELLQVIAKYEKVDLDRVNVTIDKRGDMEVLELSIMLPEVGDNASVRGARVVYA